MKVPICEVFEEPIGLGKTHTGATATIVGRIINYKDYSNIGVLYVKSDQAEGYVFSVPTTANVTIYIDDNSEINELQELWKLTGLTNNIAEHLGLNKKT